MNLDNYTQLEIEEFFDNSNVRTMLTAEMEIFFSNVDEEIVRLMHNVVKTESETIVNDIFIYILSVIGNDKVGSKIGINNKGEECSINSRYCKTISSLRDIETYNLIQAIAKCPTVIDITKNAISRFDLAMDIVAEFDGILFDLHKKTMRLDDGQFTTVTYARVDITFKEEVALMAQYNRFRLPMIETPDDWTEQERGGYKLNKSKVTTNRGDGDQPQNVLDILNKLQHQSYKLSSWVNAENERKFLNDKFAEKSASFIEAEGKANALTLTTKETYEALSGREFYFEWKFDFRGRMYSTGYDINLQADKYKKGALQPC